ncbi:MAG: hypothetical protein ACRC2T_13320 [Thermoguttaceae bacterium]
MFTKLKNFFENRTEFWKTTIIAFLLVEFTVCILPAPLVLAVYLVSGILTLCGISFIIGEQINALRAFHYKNKFVFPLLRFGHVLAVMIGLSLLAFTGYVYITTTTKTPLFQQDDDIFYRIIFFIGGIFLVVCPIIVWKTVVVMKDAIAALRQHMEANTTVTHESCVMLQKTAWKNLLVIGASLGMFVYYFVSITYLVNLKLIADGRTPNHYLDTFPFITLRCIFFTYLICLFSRGTWRYMQRKTELKESSFPDNFKSKLSTMLSWGVVVLLVISLYNIVSISEVSRVIPSGPVLVGLFTFLYLGLALLYYHLVGLISVYAIRLQIATMIPQKVAMTLAVILAMIVWGLGLL